MSEKAFSWKANLASASDEFKREWLDKAIGAESLRGMDLTSFLSVLR